MYHYILHINDKDFIVGESKYPPSIYKKRIYSCKCLVYKDELGKQKIINTDQIKRIECVFDSENG